MSFERQYLDNALFEFRRLKTLAERALAQLPDDGALHAVLDEESNSIAVVMQHLGGNMVSRWTDFLTADGEKPDRDRDSEFESHPGRARAELMETWERGWTCLVDGMESLSEDDLAKTITIRGEPLTVLEAIQRQLVHASYHVGQIVYLARHLADDDGWQSLSIPRGKSRGIRGEYKQS